MKLYHISSFALLGTAVLVTSIAVILNPDVEFPVLWITITLSICANSLIAGGQLLVRLWRGEIF